MARRVIILRTILALFASSSLILAAVASAPAATASAVSKTSVISRTSPSIENAREPCRPLHRAVLARRGAGWGDLSCAAAHERRAAAGRGAGGRSDTPPSGGYGPGQLQSAYNLAAASAADGTGQTVALVDAYDYPSAEADLAVYRSAVRPAAVHRRERLLREGRRERRREPAASPAPPDTGWTAEEALDMDMVSAIVPELPHPAGRGQRARTLRISAPPSTPPWQPEPNTFPTATADYSWLRGPMSSQRDHDA